MLHVVYLFNNIQVGMQFCDGEPDEELEAMLLAHSILIYEFYFLVHAVLQHYMPNKCHMQHYCTYVTIVIKHYCTYGTQFAILIDFCKT
jgi:hypothetical protein